MKVIHSFALLLAVLLCLSRSDAWEWTRIDISGEDDRGEECETTCDIDCGANRERCVEQDEKGCYTTCRCDPCMDYKTTCNCEVNQWKQQVNGDNGCMTCQCVDCPAQQQPVCGQGQQRSDIVKDENGCDTWTCDDLRSCETTCPPEDDCPPNGGVQKITRDDNGCILTCECYCEDPETLCPRCLYRDYYIPEGERCASCRCRDKPCLPECDKNKCQRGKQILQYTFDENDQCYSECECVDCPASNCATISLLCADWVTVEDPVTNCEFCQCAETRPMLNGQEVSTMTRSDVGSGDTSAVGNSGNRADNPGGLCSDLNCDTACPDQTTATSVVTGLCTVCKCQPENGGGRRY